MQRNCLFVEILGSMDGLIQFEFVEVARSFRRKFSVTTLRCKHCALQKQGRKLQNHLTPELQQELADCTKNPKTKDTGERVRKKCFARMTPRRHCFL